MKKLIEDITEFSSVLIGGKVYKVWAKCIYVTESNITDAYAKVFLEDQHMLVISPHDGFIYFGRIVDPVSPVFSASDEIVFNDEKYTKIVEDYQIVSHLIFGSPFDAEGEVKFIDYKNVADDSKLIRVGLMVRTNLRADMGAGVLNENDIEIIQGK